MDAERALEKLNKLKSKDAFVKVFFAADPLALWNLVSQPEDQDVILESAA